MLELGLEGDEEVDHVDFGGGVWQVKSTKKKKTFYFLISKTQSKATLFLLLEKFHTWMIMKVPEA